MITADQRQALEDSIYNTLISNPDVGMGEMGECRDTAEQIVSEWIQNNQIIVA